MTNVSGGIDGSLDSSKRVVPSQDMFAETQSQSILTPGPKSKSQEEADRNKKMAEEYKRKYDEEVAKNRRKEENEKRLRKKRENTKRFNGRLSFGSSEESLGRSVPAGPW